MLGADRTQSAFLAEVKADPRFKRGEIDVITLAGGTFMQVHGPLNCTGPHCVIHKPSAHGMQDWVLSWRGDKGIFERLCSHGVGHPDPDSVDYAEIMSGNTGGNSSLRVHGCDGCCK